MTLFAQFLVSILLIIAAAELFTNAIEWLGFRFHLASGATGSLLAAIGTSLPETVVPIIALATMAPSANEIAIGAVLGSSFLLLTVGMGVTGIAVLARRGHQSLRIVPGQAKRDLGTFLIAFALVIVSIALPRWSRWIVGAVLMVLYANYVRVTLKSGAPSEEMPEPLHLLRWRPGQPPLAAILGQLVLSLFMLIAGSHLFVDAIGTAAGALHTSPFLIALIIVPLATELPELLNSVLWIRARDDGLAFGNVAGSATFQACFLGSMGVVFTSWNVSTDGFISAGITFATALSLLLLLRRGAARGYWLMLMLVPWVGYAAFHLLATSH